MQETILIIYLVVAIALVGIILLQQGKGAEMGASFGAGGANTVFGAAGSGNALTKATTILAVLFFGIAMSLSYLNSKPAAVVDAIFDESSSIEKTDLESALPAKFDSDTSGLEAELPPTEEPAAEEVKNTSEKTVSENTTSKIKEVEQTLSADKTEEDPKEQDDQ